MFYSTRAQPFGPGGEHRHVRQAFASDFSNTHRGVHRLTPGGRNGASPQMKILYAAQTRTFQIWGFSRIEHAAGVRTLVRPFERHTRRARALLVDVSRCRCPPPKLQSRSVAAVSDRLFANNEPVRWAASELVSWQIASSNEITDLIPAGSGLRFGGFQGGWHVEI